MKYKVLGIIVAAAIGMQLIPYGKNHSNPAVVAEPKWSNLKTRELFFRACSDCHSNGTQWPWYSNIAPVSWLIQHDVDEGRKHFNISLWGLQKKNKGHESAEEIAKKKMPPWFYLIPHPDAKLSENETQEMIKGLAATFGGKEEKINSKEDAEHKHREDID